MNSFERPEEKQPDALKANEGERLDNTATPQEEDVAATESSHEMEFSYEEVPQSPYMMAVHLHDEVFSAAEVEAQIRQRTREIIDESGAIEPSQEEIESAARGAMSETIDRWPKKAKQAIHAALMATVLSFAAVDKNAEAGVNFDIAEEGKVEYASSQAYQQPGKQMAMGYGESTYNQNQYQQSYEQASEKELKLAQKDGYNDGKRGVPNQSGTPHWMHKTQQERDAYNYGYNRGAYPVQAKEQQQRQREWDRQMQREQRRLEQQRRTDEREERKEDREAERAFDNVLDGWRGVKRGPTKTRDWRDMLEGWGIDLF